MNLKKIFVLKNEHWTMKINKEILKQYEIAKIKREIRKYEELRKEYYNAQVKLELKIQSLKFKLKSYWEKFYC